MSDHHRQGRLYARITSYNVCYTKLLRERAVAEVRTIVPVGDDRSRLYELRLTLTDSKWSAGHTVRVEVPTAAAREVVAVPRDALVLRRTGTSVFRISDDDTAEQISVTTGIAAGEFIEVSNGIKPGDRVVTRNNFV